MRQTGELTHVPGVLEEDHVVCIQTDCSNVLILVKKVLHKKCHADVAVMRSLGKKVGNRVCLLYTSPSPRDRQKSRMPSSA